MTILVRKRYSATHAEGSRVCFAPEFVTTLFGPFEAAALAVRRKRKVLS